MLDPDRIQNIWIRNTVFRSFIRISIRMKCWIWIRIKDKIQEISRFKTEPRRTVDVKNGGGEVQNGGLKGSVGQWSLICITFTKGRIRTRIRIEVKS